MNKKIVLPVLAVSACFLSSCGGGGEKHKITFAGENYTIQGKAPKDFTIEVPRGQKIGSISKIKANDGYVLPEEIKVEPTKTYTYKWNRGSTEGSIDFLTSIMLDSDIKITISPTEDHNFRNVNFDLTNYSVIEGELRKEVGKPIGTFRVKTDDYYHYFGDESTVVINPKLAFSFKPDEDDPEYATLDFNDSVMPDSDVDVTITVQDY